MADSRRCFDREFSSHVPVSECSGCDSRHHPSGETIIYTAHWDHLGVDPTLEDQIYNGASDNATGTAGLMVLAQLMLRPLRGRTIVFLAVTAEESGLLGSQWYAEHPTSDCQYSGEH